MFISKAIPVRLMHLVMALFFVAVALPAQVITVSPAGPIKTLVEARDAARTLRRSGGTGPITITIRAGTYFLPETLTLGPEDSDTIWEAAHGEHPIISGGRIVSGWRKSSGAAWVADAPGSYFHQLFIDGRRAVRARTPNDAFLRFKGGGSPGKPLQLHFQGEDIKQEWASQADVEVVGFMAWSDFRAPITAVDARERLASFGPMQSSANEENARYFIENAPDALDAPGEWYLDRSTQRVSYIPLRGERMEQVQAIAAGLERLVVLQGRPETGEFVRNVVFRGLTFEHADWSVGPQGYFDLQAGMPAVSAIEAVGVVNFRVERCTVAHSGGYGLELGKGSKQNQVVANEFYDLGAGGVKVGTPDLSWNRAEQNSDNVIADNQIHDLGLVYAAGVGIWVLQSGRNQIVHNHVHDLYYTAISVGWTWGYGRNQSKGNLIAFNDLHAIGKNMLSDMGGIYTLGVQPGTIIRNNLIHDVSAFTYGGWGIYLDEGSSEILAEDNVVYNCKSAGFHQHYGRENVLRNNIFAFNREHEWMRTRPEQHVSFTLEGNIVAFDEGDVLGGDWTGGGFVTRGNLYYAARGREVRFGDQSFAAWMASGQDQGSRIADPLFVDAKRFDLRLWPESPALQMGFRPIDLSTVGPRGTAGADGW
ncbi:right-handed parallel beta-helix repeat-containing protein [Granulicella sp. dw_53]|uniref:right-handed parallel beta-helix repeat-containing protein n=1 Tax=Granulicella sp. dw_53 TaxID=2719792 RepID=UPI001BD4D730|nr:right-handed parallel beta-helix repeat-containing protein [Granulicella sp. dw_53]